MARRVRKSTRGRRNQSGGVGQGWKALKGNKAMGRAVGSQTGETLGDIAKAGKHHPQTRHMRRRERTAALEKSAERATDMKQEASDIRANFDAHAPPAAVKEASTRGRRAISHAQEQKAREAKLKRKPASEPTFWHRKIDAEKEAGKNAPGGLSISPDGVVGGWSDEDYAHAKQQSGRGRRRTQRRRTKGRRTKGRRTQRRRTQRRGTQRRRRR